MKRSDFAKHACCLILILVSGNPVFTPPLIASSLLLIALVLALTIRPEWSADAGRVSLNSIYLGIGFALLAVAQAVVLGSVSVLGTAKLVFNILVCAAILHAIGSSFAKIFADQMMVIAALSLVVFPLYLMVGVEDFPNILEPEASGEGLKSIVLYTGRVADDWARNSAFFWEPGAFQGFLNIAIALLPAKEVFGRHARLRTAILGMAVLSTLSTTGYIVFFIVMVTKLFSHKVNGALKFALAALIAGGFYASFTNLDFLGEKIFEQLDVLGDGEVFAPDRFGALLFDLNYIFLHPLVGNGLLQETRFSLHPELIDEVLGHGNGLSNFVATFGFVGLLMYILAYVFGSSKASVSSRLGICLLVLLLSIGEQFLFYPLFISLPFVIGQADERDRVIGESV